MWILESLLLAVGLSMDAFAVSVCKGLAMKKARLKHSCICGAWFGGFQALMPLIGFLVGSLFADKIEKFDHWIAFGLLVFIGVNMLREAFDKEEECCGCKEADLSFKTMLIMAIATSIDALAVGVTLRLQEANILIAAPLIAVTTGVLSPIGLMVGNAFGAKYKDKAELAGGMVLVGLGVKFLLEGLGVL